MRDPEIDDILKQAAGAKPDVDPALLDRVSRSIGSSLRPVRPLAPSWILAGGLVLICASVAVAGAMVLGPYGVRKMSAAEIGLIFSVLGILIWLAATLCVAEAIPGSRRPVTPWVLGVSGCIGLAAVFGLLFHDYRTERFISQGVACLTAGLVQALPASVAAWLLLRRGFAVNSIAAGFAKGALAGLAGVTMLELHCPNFEAPHVMVWHIAVLPISGAVGMLVAWMARDWGRRRAVVG
ncbi:MAG: NrsF family protein [Bryobacteraceae bacterium]